MRIVCPHQVFATQPREAGWRLIDKQSTTAKTQIRDDYWDYRSATQALSQWRAGGCQLRERPIG